jgi:hypothetical protein
VTASARCGSEIHDRDPVFTTAFGEVFKAEGLRIITTLPKTPRMNAICERVNGTLRRELLDRILKVAALIIKAGCLVPGTQRRRRRQARRAPRRAGTRAGRGQSGQARRSRAHPARQIGRPHRRRRTRLR